MVFAKCPVLFDECRHSCQGMLVELQGFAVPAQTRFHEHCCRFREYPEVRQRHGAKLAALHSLFRH